MKKPEEISKEPKGIEVCDDCGTEVEICQNVRNCIFCDKYGLRKCPECGKHREFKLIYRGREFI